MFKTLDFAQFEANFRQMDAILTDIETGKGRVGQFVMGTRCTPNPAAGRRRRAQYPHRRQHDHVLGQELYTDRLYHRITAPVIELDQALARLQSGQGAPAGFPGRCPIRAGGRDDPELRASIAACANSPFVQSDELYTRSEPLDR